MKRLLIFLIIFSILTGITAYTTNAQAQGGISISIFPKNPAPNDTFTVTLQSFGTDLNKTTVSWYIDGVLKEQTAGGKTISVLAGKAGIPIVVSAIIEGDGIYSEKSVNVVPSVVDLLWQANTQAPTLYKGKRLFSPQSTVTFVAIPHLISNGVEINPKNVVYTWSKDDTILGSLSGVGRDSITVRDSVLGKPIDIKVIASNLDKTIVAERAMLLPQTQPSVLLYEDNPLYGMVDNKTLQANEPIKNNELRIVAVPYFFTENAKIRYSWTANGAPINKVNGQTLTVRPKDDEKGTAKVGILVENLDHFLQSAKTSVPVLLEKAPKQFDF